MKIINIKNTMNTYLKMYDITCENSNGEERKYEMVSRTGNLTPETMGEKVNAVMIVPVVGEKLLLSREFRIPVNRWIYNFPAGLIDAGETIEQAAVRELYEETGLTVTKVLYTLPPSYSSSGMTDERLAIVFVQAEGEIIGSDNVNEEIESRLYTVEELKDIVSSSGDMCSRTQLAIMLFVTCNNKLADLFHE